MLQCRAEPVETGRVRDSCAESAAPDAETATLVREFVPLNRRRLQGARLDAAEQARWEALRDAIEEALGAVPPPHGQRRRALRVRTHLKALVTTSVVQELLRVHDLSESGVFLRTDRPVAPGTPLQLELQDRSGHSLELEGSVIWVRIRADGFAPSGMGVALHALSDRDRSLLTELVESALELL